MLNQAIISVQSHFRFRTMGISSKLQHANYICCPCVICYQCTRWFFFCVLVIIGQKGFCLHEIISPLQEMRHFDIINCAFLFYYCIIEHVVKLSEGIACCGFKSPHFSYVFYKLLIRRKVKENHTFFKEKKRNYLSDKFHCVVKLVKKSI